MREFPIPFWKQWQARFLLSLPVSGENVELVQQNINGFLVPVGDVNAITSALLQYAMSPRLREQHGQAGRRIAIEQFSIDRMVRGYEKVYHRVASGQDRIV
jgi:glycosyltransferase involved in cell wall biosynthesis